MINAEAISPTAIGFVVRRFDIDPGQRNMPFLVLVGDNVTRISDGLNNVELRREFQNFRMLLVGLSFKAAIWFKVLSLKPLIDLVTS